MVVNEWILHVIDSSQATYSTSRRSKATDSLPFTKGWQQAAANKLGTTWQVSWATTFTATLNNAIYSKGPINDNHSQQSERNIWNG